MALGEALGGPVVHNGREYPRLKMGDFAKICAAIKDKWKKDIRAVLDECGIKDAERAAQIRAMTPASEPMLGDVQAFIRTIDGAKEAVRLSLRRSNMDAKDVEQALDEFGAVELVELAGDVAGFPLIVKTAGKDSDPNAGAGATPPTSIGTPPAPESVESTGATPQS